VSYRVEWVKEALDALTTVWTGASDRNAVTRAAEAIDRALADDPFGVSESREGANRVLTRPPLAAYFRVVADAVVVVYDVRISGRPR
jgi:hypothetical protein